MTTQQGASTPAWCWSAYDGASCQIAAGHKGSHAGASVDGKWLRWTDDMTAKDGAE